MNGVLSDLKTIEVSRLFHTKSGSDTPLKDSAIASSQNLDELIANSDSSPEPSLITKTIGSNDIVYYIYTSGTTGKSAYIRSTVN